MTWAKVDDQFHAHRKAKRAWKAHPRALGLHLLALSYCAGQLTDGFVDDEFVEEKVPVTRERQAVAVALEGAGLWLREKDGWRINDWLDFNPSRADVIGKRQRDSERKRRKESEQSPNGIHAEAARTPSDPRTCAPPVPARPIQSQGPPCPPRGNRERDRKAWEESVVAWAESVGVTGPRHTVLTALRGCGPWSASDAPASFRAHAQRHFPSSLTVEEAA